jgi:hypothetical protein
MRLFIGLISYLIGSVALAAAAAILIVVLATPAVTTVLSRPDTAVVAPRIQMWLDRHAEEAVYAERRQAMARAEEEKWRAIAARIRIPTAADHAAFAKAHDEDRRALAREISAQKRENAKRLPPGGLRQAAPFDAPPVRPASSYYPDLHARIY